MPDLTTPIEVRANTGIIDLLTAAGRYLVVIASTIPLLMTVLGTKDIVSIIAFFQGEDGAKLLAAVIGLGTFAYGLYKTRKRGAQAVVLADAAPNAVAKVV